MSWIIAVWLLVSAFSLTLGISDVRSQVGWAACVLVGLASWIAVRVTRRQSTLRQYPLAVVLVGTSAYVAAVALGDITTLGAAAACGLGFMVLAWLRPWWWAALYGAGLAVALDQVSSALSRSSTSFLATWDFPLLLSFLAAASYCIHYVRTDLDKARREAGLDPLTGLQNRRNLQQASEKLSRQAQETGRHVAVLTVDLDHFKNINDTYGHDAGDKILVSVAKTLQRKARAEDVVARMGGEEFVVLAVVPDVFAAQDCAERIRQAVADVEFQEPITASVGVAIAGYQAEPLESLMSRADSAMYLAKESGRNAVRTAP